MLESWPEWQMRVVAAIRESLAGALDHVDFTDVDWEAWRPLYDQGRSPRAAVEHAFLCELPRR